jgi:hypothetical protein
MLLILICMKCLCRHTFNLLLCCGNCCRSSSQEREGVVQAAVSQLVTQLAVAQGNLCRLQLSLDGSRLGGLGLARNGALGFAEVCVAKSLVVDLNLERELLQVGPVTISDGMRI